MIDLQASPFFLDEESIKWVENTLESMTDFQKAAQLFNCVSAGESCETLRKRYDEIPFGGITFRADYASAIKERVEDLQNYADIPLLVSANLENGGSGLLVDGTEFASQLEVGATGDPKYAYELGKVCGAEGSSVGCNYTFSPVVDVHYNWRNAIINTRTYGNDPNLVIKFASEYIRGIREYNMAVAIKHFPGDGVDERDQHLLTSVNSFSCQEWDNSYGRIYKELISQGAQSVMVGHILLPSYSRQLCQGIQDKDILPASLSPELLQGLLRGKLGFNGVIITDSAVMTGLGCALPRKDIPAAAINAGCDMFLFGRNFEEDFNNFLESVKDGTVSQERLDEAVTRVLALKASLGLHKTSSFTRANYKEVVGCKKFSTWAEECADRAITLVKDTQNLLPVTPQSYPRIWLHILGDNPGFRGGHVCREQVIDKLTEAGFTVTCADPDHPELSMSDEPVKELKKKYDLILYIANIVTGRNSAVNRISWLPSACGESPQYVKDIPTMFISLGDPYHFVDVPMIQTFINCYENSDEVLDELILKIMGKSKFHGVSPVDPFCGMWGKDF